jgi:hypothetical protein
MEYREYRFYINRQIVVLHQSLSEIASSSSRSSSKANMNSNSNPLGLSYFFLINNHSDRAYCNFLNDSFKVIISFHFMPSGAKLPAKPTPASSAQWS